MHSPRVCWLPAACSCPCSGCPVVKPVVLDRKTQLENQMLGTFQRLEENLILASSVRAERPEPR